MIYACGPDPPRDFVGHAITRVLLVVPPNGFTCWHEALDKIIFLLLLSGNLAVTDALL